VEILKSPSNVQAPERSSALQRSPRTSAQFDLEDLYCVMQTNAHDHRTALKLSQKLTETGRLNEALRVLQSLIKIDSGFETLLALGLLEFRLEMESDSLHHLQQALLVAPDDEPKIFEILKTLGNIFVRRGDFDSAEENYNKAYRLKPESDVLLVNLGTLCIQKQDWEDAVARFRSALEINMVNDKAWVGLAIGHRMKGDFELAWGNLEAALEYNPLNEAALTLALDWAPTDGKESRVLEMLRAFLVEGGWSEKFSLAFAWLCWRRGERSLARLEAERLLAVNPNNENAMKLVFEMRASD
jgi:Flp pilus assembly protein TadD